jgi:threonyl-tRNA synthetase
MGILIEHYAGAFPLWLSPIQARVLPVSEKHAEYGIRVRDALVSASVRADIDDANESLGKKIRNATVEKIPYLLVVGDKEVTDETVTVESRSPGKLGAMSLEDFTLRVKKEIGERS